MILEISTKKGLKILSVVLVLFCIVFEVKESKCDPPVASSRLETLSGGTPMKGYLKNGEVLPKQGVGYVLIEKTRKRKARFGVSELIKIIKQAAYRVYRKQKGGLLHVADLSSRVGGSIDHHGSRFGLNGHHCLGFFNDGSRILLTCMRINIIRP